MEILTDRRIQGIINFTSPITYILLLSVGIIWLLRVIDRILNLKNWYFFYFKTDSLPRETADLVISTNKRMQRSNKNVLTKYVWGKIAIRLEKRLY